METPSTLPCPDLRSPWTRDSALARSRPGQLGWRLDSRPGSHGKLATTGLEPRAPGKQFWAVTVRF